MKLRMLLIGVSWLVVISATSQFTYFNFLDGPSGENPETTTNIEIVDSTILVFGGVNINGDQSKFLRRYNNDGLSLEEVLYSSGESFVYSGATHSFLSIPNSENYLFTQGKYTGGIGEGYIVRFDSDLDTLWSRTYNEYYPDTYFFTHAVSENGFIIAGEHVVQDPTGRGTFIMETDTLGEVLWHQEIHAPEEGLYRNYNVSQFEDFYLVSGYDQADNSEGYIEILDLDGTLLDHIEAPAGGMTRGFMLHFINEENEVIVCHGRSEEESGIFSFTYNSLFFSKLDVQEQELVIQNQLMQDQQWIAAAPVKIIEIADGYVIAGRHRVEENGQAIRKAWIMKVDDDFQMEWYTPLSYNNAPGNAHFPYDMEQTSDGGYVVVGAYRNDADFYDRTWLVKVDACGDEQWQGCEDPNGLWESGPSTSSVSDLLIYPNPATDLVRVALPFMGRGPRGLSIQIIDITGKEVKRMSNNQLTISNDQVEVDVSNLPSGFYSILCTTDEGEVYSGKLMVE